MSPFGGNAIIAAFLALSSAFLGACNSDTQQPDATLDAGIFERMDALLADASEFHDANAVDALAADTGVECSACSAADVCETADCVEGECVRSPRLNGSACNESGSEICVASQCVTRGCQDGYREPGPSPAREACDDGNASDNDACDASCEPRIAYLEDPGEGSDFSPLAAESEEQVLVVWTHLESGLQHLRGRRYTSAGSAVDPEPFTLAEKISEGWSLGATVAALEGGWVVGWSTPFGDTDGGIAFVTIDLDGSVSAPQFANDTRAGRQHQPSIAKSSAGFFIVWADESEVARGDLGGIRGRLFSRTGSAAGAEFAIETTTDGIQSEPSAASLPAGPILVSYTTEGAGGLAVVFRRLDETGFLDDFEVPLAEESSRSHVMAEGSSFLVLHVSHENPANEEVVLHRVEATGSPVDWGYFSATSVRGIPSAAPIDAGIITVLETSNGVVLNADGVVLPTLLAPAMTQSAEATPFVTQTDDGVWIIWSAVRATGNRGLTAYLWKEAAP